MAMLRVLHIGEHIHITC